MSEPAPVQSIPRLTEATLFAARAHCTQRRKGRDADPYVNHVIEVADRLARATEGSDLALVVAGLLHDTIEDCGVTAGDLTRRFGEDVAALVVEVTDDRPLSREERKRAQIGHMATISERAPMLKVADKASNLRDIALAPGSDWSAKRRHDYVLWADKVVAPCRGLNATLDRGYDEARSLALKAIERDEMERNEAEREAAQEGMAT